MTPKSKRRIEFQEAEFKLSEFLCGLERDYNLTIAEVVDLLSTRLQRFIRPVVADEWRSR